MKIHLPHDWYDEDTGEPLHKWIHLIGGQHGFIEVAITEHYDEPDPATGYTGGSVLADWWILGAPADEKYLIPAGELAIIDGLVQEKFDAI
jgi:hypothetical protein